MFFQLFLIIKILSTWYRIYKVIYKEAGKKITHPELFHIAILVDLFSQLKTV